MDRLSSTVSSQDVHHRPNGHMGLFIWAAIVFLATYAVRVTFILETKEIQVFKMPVPGMDVDLYWQAAKLLSQGTPAGEPRFELMMCSSPLYPIWLSFWQGILGPWMYLHRWLNALLVSFNAVMIFALVLKLTHARWVAVAGGLAWALMPSLIFFDAVLYKSSLTLLVLCLLLALVVFEDGAGHILACLAKGMGIGLLFGALNYLQGTAVLIFVAILFFIGIDNRRELKMRGVLAASAIGVYLLVLAIVHQNQGVAPPGAYPRYIPQKGIHMKIGFNPRAKGTYTRIAGVHPWPYGHNFQSRMRAELDLGRRLSPAKADRYYMDQAIQYIANHPGKALHLIFRKAVLFFNNHEVKGADDLYFAKKKSRILAATPMGLGVLVVLAGAGAVHLLATRQYRLFVLLAGLLLAVLVSNVAIFISWRYRIFNVVPLLLLACLGLRAVQIQIRPLIDPITPPGRRLRFFFTVIVPMLICGGLAYYPLAGLQKAQAYGMALQNEALSKKAQQFQAMLQQKQYVAPAHPVDRIKKAQLLQKLHRHSAAFQMVKALYEEEIYDFRTISCYLTYLMWLGEYDHAVNVVQSVRHTDPLIMHKSEATLKGIEKETYSVFIKNAE